MKVETKNLEILFENQWVQMPDRLFQFSKNIEWCGKSDLMHLYFQVLFGVEKNYKGEVFWNGVSLKKMTFQENMNFRQKCSLVFDWGGLISNQSILENILLPCQFHNREVSVFRKEVESFFALIDQTDKLNERPHMVSQNIRKIASILRACALEPDVVFIEDISMGMQSEEVSALEFFITKHIPCLHYYDSLGKFSHLNADKISVLEDGGYEKAS